MNEKNDNSLNQETPNSYSYDPDSNKSLEDQDFSNVNDESKANYYGGYQSNHSNEVVNSMQMGNAKKLTPPWLNRRGAISILGIAIVLGILVLIITLFTK